MFIFPFSDIPSNELSNVVDDVGCIHDVYCIFSSTNLMNF